MHALSRRIQSGSNANGICRLKENYKHELARITRARAPRVLARVAHNCIRPARAGATRRDATRRGAARRCAAPARACSARFRFGTFRARSPKADFPSSRALRKTIPFRSHDSARARAAQRSLFARIIALILERAFRRSRANATASASAGTRQSQLAAPVHSLAYDLGERLADWISF